MLPVTLVALSFVCVVQAAMTTYNIDVQTGSVANAGTDANVFINIMNEEGGETGRIPLRASKTYTNKFERYHLDKFTVQAVDVGKIERIRIEHDKAGHGSGWYLDDVVITVKGTTCKIVFHANRWIQYRDTADTYAYLFPKRDKTSCPQQVRSKSLQLCELTRPTLIVCPSNAGISIVKALYGRTSTRACAHGSHHRGVTNCRSTSSLATAKRLCDGKRWCRLVAADSMFGNPCPGVSKYLDVTYGCRPDWMTTYNVDVKTGNVAYAGTDANVFIFIYGDKGQTKKIILRTSQTFGDAFQASHLDKFTFSARDVGRISKISVGHDNKRQSPGWYLDNVVINVMGTACKATFTANRWLSGTALETALYPVFDSATCAQGKKNKKYNIDVKTSNKWGAGTDANVFIIIYGGKYDTGKLLLTKSKTHSDPFESNYLDKFTVEGMDVGKITKIRIGHDNTGSGAGWHLQSVVIGIEGTTCKSSFHAGKWIQTGMLEVELSPTGNGCT